MTLFFIVSNNYKNIIKVLVILLFYTGLAAFLGKSIENPYKIVLVLTSIFVVVKNSGLYQRSRKEDLLLIVFLLFSFSFLFSCYVNGDYFTLTFSQYGKYITPVCLYFVLNHLTRKYPDLTDKYIFLFFSLLTIQIILSFVKIFSIGIQESTVGSIAYIGGGQAAILPVMGFILVWVYKKGILEKKDWLYIFSLLFIGFASMKRAIWFIMPVFILLFMYYVPGKVKSKQWLYISILVPFIFYLGIRFSPTLNKEGKIGGSFNFQYVKDYAQEYNFGKKSESSEIKSGEGRGGATLLLFEKLFQNESLTFNDYLGYGLQEMYTTDYGTFDEEKFGVNSKGAATGIFQTYITSGYIGILFTILFLISIIMLIKEPRIRITIGLFMFYDYLFYSGLILRTQALFVLLFFIIIYANRQFEENFSKKLSFCP